MSTINWPEQFVLAHSQAKDARLRDYYGSGMIAPDCLLNQAPLVALDLETTGLDPVNDGIISIGLVPFSLQRIQLGQAAQWLVKPRQQLGDDSVMVHGITHDRLDQAPDFEHIIEPLLQALSGRIVVVHYREIERNFLHQAFIKRLGETLEFPVIDTFDIERRALLRRQGLIGRLLRRPLGSLNLSSCRRRYGLPYYRAHHALTDAIATAELLQAQIRYHYRDDTRSGDLWL